MSAQLQGDQPEQPKHMSDEDLINAIDDMANRSYGSGWSNITPQLAEQRALALKLYLGVDVDPAPEGQSTVVDRTVFETVQWILPSLCRIFANGDDVVTLVPTNKDDIDQAKQETAYLNWLVTNKHPWFELFLEFATDILLAPNAYLLVYKDLTRQVEIEKYEGQTKIGVSYLLQDPEVQLIDSRQYEAPDLPPEPVMDPQTGQPIVGPNGQPMLAPAMLYDITVRRTSSSKELCIRVLPPERVQVDQLTPGWRLDRCNYFEYWEEVTISSLREQGFDIPDDVANNIEPYTQEDVVRDQYGENRLNMTLPSDPSMRRVKARMVWVRVDADGDGEAELIQTMVVGREVLYREEVSRIPAASGSASPLPHRHVGMSVADMVVEIQRIKTAIIRQGLDNLYLSNNPQKVLNEQMVNIDDALISIPGGVIRATDINQIRYEETPFVFPQAVAGMQYMSEVAQNRTGVNNGFAGVDSANLNNIQPGTVNQLSSMAAERVVQIARILALAIEDLFSIIHEQVLKMGHKRETLQIAGQWVEVDPGSWKKRTAFKTCVAFAAGNKDAQIGRLMAVAQKQVEAMTLQLPVVTPANYYATMVELTKAIDFTSPERFWTDPINIPPKPPQVPEGVQKSMIDASSKEKIVAAELIQRENESIRKAELDKYAIDSQAGLEIVHKQVEHGHTVALEGLKASHAAILTGLNAKVDGMAAATTKAVGSTTDAIQSHTNSLDNVHQTLDHVFDAVKKAGALATARRVIRKNANGEIDGIDLLDHEGKVLASHKAIKDKTGRVTGMQ